MSEPPLNSELWTIRCSALSTLGMPKLVLELKTAEQNWQFWFGLVLVQPPAWRSGSRFGHSRILENWFELGSDHELTMWRVAIFSQKGGHLEGAGAMHGQYVTCKYSNNYVHLILRDIHSPTLNSKWVGVHVYVHALQGETLGSMCGWWHGERPEARMCGTWVRSVGCVDEGWDTWMMCEQGPGFMEKGEGQGMWTRARMHEQGLRHVMCEQGMCLPHTHVHYRRSAGSSGPPPDMAKSCSWQPHCCNQLACH